MYGDVIPSLAGSAIVGAAKAFGRNAGTSTVLSNVGELAANYV